MVRTLESACCESVVGRRSSVISHEQIVQYAREIRCSRRHAPLCIPVVSVGRRIDHKSIDRGLFVSRIENEWTIRTEQNRTEQKTH